MAENINLSGLNDNNDLSSPDGMWFYLMGVLWIQTDDGAYTDTTNCMMLEALPVKWVMAVLQMLQMNKQLLWV